ncbi:toxin TcdB middle/N-terminal domain-containing protein [Methylobacter sp. sgz302048]|uniref:toxin TcdB middle/N-terminal domain-containing protein n=1 Tax=Methylobacter sp. sgz302048 TaxID=3455945 RepID=UPI003FA0526C
MSRKLLTPEVESALIKICGRCFCYKLQSSPYTLRPLRLPSEHTGETHMVSHFTSFSLRLALVVVMMVTSLPIAVPATAQSPVAGGVGPSFTESSAAVFTGALQMATVEPSSGVLRTAVAIDYPAARGASQPGLGLSYSSASGIREAGMGWGLNLPAIERQGPAGGPPLDSLLGDDPFPEDIIGTGTPGENTEQEYNERYERMTPFAFNGKPLVPLCEVGSTRHRCTTPDSSVLPDWAENGAIYFRLAEDSAFARFFWSRDRKTWLVQYRGGEMLELGRATVLPLPGDEFATEQDVRWRQYSLGLYTIKVNYRWRLARRFDPAADGGQPRNIVVYQWRKLGETGLSSLTDVYYTPPAEWGRDWPLLDTFAHHIRLDWNRPIQIRNSYAPIWRATPDYHVARIDVASKPFEQPERPRQMVRRYHLTYDEQGHRSYLTSVQMEGRCDAPLEEVAGALPASSCPRLPAVTLRYSAPESNRIPSSVLFVPSMTPWAGSDSLFPSSLPGGSNSLFPSLTLPGGSSLNLIPLDLNNDSLPDFIEVRRDVNSAALPADRRNRIAIDNGTWHVPDWIRNEGYAFTGYGYTFTGDFTSRGETGARWILPSVVGALDFAPSTSVPNLGVSGWEGLEQPTPLLIGALPSYGRIQLAGDVNGDGLLDLLNYADETDSGFPFGDSSWTAIGYPRPADWRTRAHIGVYLARRSPDGSIDYMDTSSTCFGPSPEDMDGDWPNGEQSVHLADMNGDSLDDLVAVGANKLRYWPSDGRGNFTACRGVGCTCTTPTTSALPNSMLPFDRGLNQSPKKLILADVNGDGYADFVSWNRDELRVAFNNDGWFFRAPIVIPAFWFGQDWPTAVDNNVELVTTADMNGNGIADIVTSAGDEIDSLDLHRIGSIISTFAPDAWAPRPGLLIEINNGLGARTQIAYESTGDMARTALITKKPWPEPLPQVMQVVQRVTTSTSVQGAEPIRTFYNYDDPAWDGWERRLRGFRKVTIFQGEPQTATEYTFFIPSCPGGFCGSTDYTFLQQSVASGSLLTVEVRDAQGQYHSTTSYSYDVQSLAKGLDGRSVYTASVARVDTRLYDTTAWDPINASAEQTIRLKAREGGGPIWTGRSPVRARHSVLLRTTLDTDEFGTTIAMTDHGRIKADGQAIDDPIVTSWTMHPLRPDWRFLVDHARTEPFVARPGVPVDLPRTVLYEYDEAGRLSAAQSILLGTLPLDRRHEDPLAATAPAPPGASYTTLALLGSYHYDAFDNVVRHEAPAGTCVFFDYDRAYAQLLVSERAAADGCTGTRELVTAYAWDGGLQAVLNTTEPNGAVSRELYDGLGRWTAAYLPDPATGAPQPQPSLAVQYFVQPGGPVQRMRTEARIGPGSSLVEWKYSDGFGQKLLTLRQADPAAGDGGTWIGAGLPQRNTAGAVVGTYGPWFYSGDPAAHPLTTPSTPRSTIKLDSFDRPAEFVRADGTMAGRRIYRPLSLESRDATGRGSRVSVDGHGRLREQRSLVGQSESVVSIDYLVGGEAARIMRKSISPFYLQPPTVVRWMQYDSLGRMVLNAEPNTATGFLVDPAQVTALHAWRYAYDFGGRLVGTSDARGCGWNKSYDPLGRLVAVDLSPCLRSQAPYTPPNLADGTGTEAFFRYDIPEPGQIADYGSSPQFLAGQLVSVRDRAVHTRFAYDARGRLVGAARRLARPAGLDAVWPGAVSLSDRYASDWFRSVTEYDDADRLLAMTTGVSAPELLDSQGQSRLTFAYSQRGVVTRIGGSYGDLVTGTVYDALGRPVSLTMGDAAGTRLETTYGPSGSLATFRATRSAPGLWTIGVAGYTPPGVGDPPTTQTVLEDLLFHTDSTGLLTGIDDLRSPAAWPDGAKPVNRTFSHDNIGRLTGALYQYPGGPDAPAAASDRPGIPTAASAQRPAILSLKFDDFGNLAQTIDDATALFDRSLGDIVRGDFEAGPDRLVTAANGDVAAEYDAAGNLVSLTVKRSACSAPSGVCSHRLIYDWDESGQLARARRWDFSTIDANVPAYPAVPASAPAADLRYRYDSVGARVLRSAASNAGGELTHSAWPLGLIRLEGAAYDSAANAYARTAATEEIAVPGLARVVHRPGMPGPSPQHVLLSIGDHLGSPSSVVDKATGELVERLSYLPYGGLESAYRPARWAGATAREGFTGKEEDAAVALVYFGARYYLPNLGQWLSPDPLTIHGLGLPDLNPYSYVGGRVIQASDANGLQPCIGFERCDPIGGGSNGGVQVGSGDGGGGQGPDPSEAAGRRPVPRESRPLPDAPPRNSGVMSPAVIPFWQALGRPETWASTVDASVIEGFNAGVTKNETALVGTGITAATSSLLLGGMGAYELGAGLFSAASSALRGVGASVYITAGRTAAWFNELCHVEQGLTVGSGGGLLMGGVRAFESTGGGGKLLMAGMRMSRVGRAKQIFNEAVKDAPGLGRSTISVADLVSESGVTQRVISTNRSDTLRWLQRNLVLKPGEYLVPWTRNGTHAELVGAKWGIKNGFLRGAFGTSTRGCTDCIWDIHFLYNLGQGTVFTHDNPDFTIMEILANPTFFGF